MEIRAVDQIGQQKPFKINKKLLLKLTIGGGFAFWLASIATSLLPIAAKYRAAFTNWSIQTVWFGSLFAGMIIGCCVSYLLLRFLGETQPTGAMCKSVTLSFIALVIAVILIDIPMVFPEQSASMYYLLIGVLFNTVRFLFLGIVVGYLYKKLYSVRSDESEDLRQAN